MTAPSPAQVAADEVVVQSRGDGTRGAHRVVWSDGVPRFICDEQLGAECKAWCTSCDDGCGITDEDGTEHVWEAQEHCRVMDWLDAVGWRETYLDEDIEIPQVDGPIETEWDGDNYLWALNVPEADAAVEASDVAALRSAAVVAEGTQ